MTFVPAQWDLDGLAPSEWTIVGLSDTQLMVEHNTTGRRELRGRKQKAKK